MLGRLCAGGMRARVHCGGSSMMCARETSYGVLARRRGRVLKEDIIEGTQVGNAAAAAAVVARVHIPRADVHD